MRNFFLLLFTVIIVGFTTSCTTDLNEDVQYEASIAEADYQKAVQETVERISTEEFKNQLTKVFKKPVKDVQFIKDSMEEASLMQDTGHDCRWIGNTECCQDPETCIVTCTTYNM